MRAGPVSGTRALAGGEDGERFSLSGRADLHMALGDEHLDEAGSKRTLKAVPTANVNLACAHDEGRAGFFATVKCFAARQPHGVRRV